VCSFLGFFSGLIILFFGIKSNPHNQPLAIGQILSALAIFVIFLLVSKLILYWPFMYRMGNVFTLLFIPLPFLNVVFHTQKRVWRWYDLVHILPLLIYLADYGHVLLMSNAAKVEILKEELNNLNLLGQFRQSRYFGSGFHENFRAVVFSMYWIGQVIFLVKWAKGKNTLSAQEKVWKNWTQVFLFFQFFMFLPAYLTFLGLDFMGSYHMVNSSLVIWLLTSTISLFFFPSIIYGNTKHPAMKEKLTTLKEGLSKLEIEKLRKTYSIIETQMEIGKPFLLAGYSINDLSKQINIPVYQISKSLNTIIQLNFLDYINNKRIQYCKTHFTEEEWRRYSIEAIALKSGFSNRNTFTRSFKKVEGILPSDFSKKEND
jgi:AraC-like DNA-binding protein